MVDFPTFDDITIRRRSQDPPGTPRKFYRTHIKIKHELQSSQSPRKRKSE